MNIEWLKNKTKEKFYPITHAKAVLFGNSNKTLDEEISDINNSISSHTSNTSNPHSVTKAQVGLGNVENKSSATIRGEITKSNVTTALGYTPLNQSLKGSASGLAELDSNGKVPSSQLPSYVDDVVEGYLSGGKFYKESAHTTEISGETGKIYIDLSTEKTYRWSGSTFVVISETLALGETSSTAYRGDRGKVAYDHSQSTHARTDATKVEKSSTNGNIKINGTETTVYDDTEVKESISTQSTEILDIKMLGWSVPKECPIKNEVNGNQFIQKVGRVDLGKYDYVYQSSFPRFYTIKHIPNSILKDEWNTNIYSEGYLVYTVDDNSIDKSMCMYGGLVYFKDTRYTDATSFKTAMQGQYLYYELSTPITTTIDGNEIGETVSDVRKETTVNLLKPTLGTVTQNGVTCTNNGDGTYTLKGTATATVFINLGICSFEKNKTYKLLGWGNTKYKRDAIGLYIETKKRNVFDENGEGGFYTPSSDESCNINIVVINNTTIPNAIIKPMLTTNLNATYDDFVPYTGSTGQINSDVADIQSALDGKSVSKTLTNENLNNVTTPGFYNAGGGNTVTNKPSGIVHFGLIVIHRASGAYYTQIIFNDTSSYRRFCVNGTWGSWAQDKLTDTTYSTATTSASGLMSSSDKTKLNGIATGAEVNQNAFSNVVVGSTTVSADSKTDTLTLVAGSNVTITPDTTNDKITISSAHPSISKSTDSTSTASPSAGGTFTAVDSVTRDGNGHVTKVNTKTVTLPNTAVVVDSTLSSTSTNPVQNKVVYDALKGKSDTGHTHNYAGSNSAGGNALKLYLPREGNDANWLPDNGSTMQMRELHSMSSNLPEENFFQIIACRSGDEGYGSQLAMGMTTNNLYFRNYNNGNFNTWRKVAFADSYLPLSGGTLTGDLNIGGKVGFNANSEGGNIYWRSPKGVQWEFDCFNENFRLFNYNSYKDFVITRDEGDVHLPNNLYLGASAPILKLNNLYIHRNGGSNCETHIYGNTASYPHIMLRQYSNAFQFLPHTNYEIDNGSHIGHSQYRFGAGYFTDVYNSSGAITTSDRNKKHDIEEITDEFSEKIVDGLIPSSFKFNDGSSGRTHFGIIAQDLEKLLESLGISTTDFAPLVKEYPDKEVEIENPDYDENDEKSQKYIKKLEKDYDAEPIYNVRYEEFIMILVKYCQGLKKKDLDLEKRLSELEEKVNKLIAG